MTEIFVMIFPLQEKLTVIVSYVNNNVYIKCIQNYKSLPAIWFSLNTEVVTV
jgi:hypothetical protein